MEPESDWDRDECAREAEQYRQHPAESQRLAGAPGVTALPAAEAERAMNCERQRHGQDRLWRASSTSDVLWTSTSTGTCCGLPQNALWKA